MKFLDLVEKNKQRDHEARMQKQGNLPWKIALVGIVAVASKKAMNNKKNSC